MDSLKTGMIIALLVVVSGCIALPNVFGNDVINIQQSTTQNGARDILIVKDVQTIPKSPLLPNQQLLMSLIVENKDRLKTAQNVRVDLFNAPLLRSVSNDPNLNNKPCNLYAVQSADAGATVKAAYCNQCIADGHSGICARDDGTYAECVDSGQCTSGTFQTCEYTPGLPSYQRYCFPDQCGIIGCNVLPGEEKPITFVMKTPTQDDIKNIKTDVTMSFKTTYTSDGSLTYIVPAVNMAEIIKRQRSGDKTNLATSKSFGSGPVQIDAELQGAQYILDSYDAMIFFTIKNVGSGTLVGSQIDQGKLSITFPPDFDVAGPQDKFTCISNSDGSTTCTNSVPGTGVIPLYRDQSRSSLRFSIRLHNQLQEPFRSYQITAAVKYDYELRNSLDMTINPFQNV